jgi:predicted nucleotidyltransferase component of viral defense system
MGFEMLTLDQLTSYFPEDIFRKTPHGALVEYLQHELLDSLFKNPDARHLSFIGGTAIRILHQSIRFSEDLDFDSFDLSFDGFEALLVKACRDMEYKGFIIEYRMVEKGAFHCYIRFPEILYKSGISPDKGRKILIQVDTEPKKPFYKPNVTLMNRFAVFRRILAAPPEILLSQKMMAVLYRKREKGRDIFDVSFLTGITTPDFGFIQNTLGMSKSEFIRMFDKRLDELDLNYMAGDVEPFLFNPEQKERVLFFRESWEQLKGLWGV